MLKLSVMRGDGLNKVAKPSSASLSINVSSNIVNGYVFNGDHKLNRRWWNLRSSLLEYVEAIKREDDCPRKERSAHQYPKPWQLNTICSNCRYSPRKTSEGKAGE